MTRVLSMDAVSIGEGQLRLVTEVGTPLAGMDSLRVYVAGTEGNIMGLISRLGGKTGIVSALPDSAIADRVISEYALAGVDTSRVRRTPGGRVALYFLEQGSPPVPSRVLYDRKDSSFAGLTVDDVDWDYLASARLLHLSGITAALNDELYKVVATARNQARAAGQMVSFDINYRQLLSEATTARERLRPLVEGVDVLFCSRRDARRVFGIEHDDPAEVVVEIGRRLGVNHVVMSDGAHDAYSWIDGVARHGSPPPTTIVDRVGAGDAFVGAYLHSFLRGVPDTALRLALAAAALSLTRLGDQLTTTLAELVALAADLTGGTDIVR